MISRERIIAFTEVLRQSQFWPPEKMRAYQEEQLARLLRHAYETVPFYRDRLAPLFRRRWGPRMHKWHEIPILTRSDLSGHVPIIRARAIPTEHGEPVKISTSGSTGVPLSIWKTPFAAMATNASTIRDFEWHDVDANRSFALIVGHIGRYPEGANSKGWSDAHLALGYGGTGHRLDIATPTAHQVEWLERIRPAYLASHASNLAEIARLTMLGGKSGISPLKTFAGGECVTETNRQLCRTAWGAPPIERYGAQEAGNIATECPECRQLHVHDEIILVEVVDDAGLPVNQGETGRVVITPFYNYATPLLRYEIGDWAILGDRSICSKRTTPIAEILGRLRDMFVFRDGTRRWPGLSDMNTQTLFPIRQYQFIQETLDKVIFNFTADEEPSAEEKLLLANLVRDLLRQDVQIKINRIDTFERHASGKFVGHISRISAQAPHNRSRSVP